MSDVRILNTPLNNLIHQKNAKAALRRCSQENVYVANLQENIHAEVIEIPFRHGCFPVNLLHIFRIPFYKNTYCGLLLEMLKVLEPNSELKCICQVYKLNISKVNQRKLMSEMCSKLKEGTRVIRVGSKINIYFKEHSQFFQGYFPRISNNKHQSDRFTSQNYLDVKIVYSCYSFMTQDLSQVSFI